MFGSFTMCHPADTGHDRPMTSHPDRRRRLGRDEKPAHPTPMPNDPTLALCSMGIYLFRTATLHEYLLADAERVRLARRSRQAHRPAARETRIRQVVEVIAAATSAAALLTATGALPH